MFSCLSSSLSSLPSGRSERPMAPFLSLLCLFFQFSLPFFHHPVQKFLSRSSSASFSSSLPSIISLCSESPRNKCPIQIFCLVFTVSTRDLFSSTRFSTSSFVTCVVQRIVSILLHIHISKASSLLMSSFLIVHVSAPYNVTLQINVFTIRFFRCLFNPPLSNSFLFVNASFPLAILLLISL